MRLLTIFVGRNTPGIDGRPSLLSTTNDIDDFDLVIAFDISHTVHLAVEFSEGLFASGTAA